MGALQLFFFLKERKLRKYLTFFTTHAEKPLLVSVKPLCVLTRASPFSLMMQEVPGGLLRGRPGPRLRRRGLLPPPPLGGPFEASARGALRCGSLKAQGAKPVSQVGGKKRNEKEALKLLFFVAVVRVSVCALLLILLLLVLFGC